MGATKRDFSGVFDAELKVKLSKQSVVLDNPFHLSHKGITFMTDQAVPEWTEVGVKVRLPQKSARKDSMITCRGVVVECSRCQANPGYRITLLFLDLPKRAQEQLAFPATAPSPASISITH